jgi:hypothetical protein
MCVGVESTQASVRHGQAAQWVITVYTTGATTTNATVSVAAAPAGQHAAFDFGCGQQDRTAACALGTVNVGAAARQVQAQITVPATSTVTAVRLTATVSADHLSAGKPAVAVTVAVSAGAAAASPAPADYLNDSSFRDPSYLPLVGSGPGASKLSPGGNASGLFPELTPGGTGPGASGGAASRGSDTVALSATSVSEAGAQVAGLVALILAFLLAVAHRVEIRVAGHQLTPIRLSRFSISRPLVPRLPKLRRKHGSKA